jgi:hypothetical protein
MKRVATGLVAALSVSCASGSSPASGSDAGVPGNGCGDPGNRSHVQCASLTDCGGPANYVHAACPNCFSTPSAQVCEAGLCRQIDRSGKVSIDIGVPPTAAGAQSFVLATVDPVMADGTHVNCPALLSTCSTLDNPLLNTGDSTFKVIAGGADPAFVYTNVTIDADVGSGRLFVLRVVADVGGGGAVLAAGCIGGLDIASNQTTVVEQCAASEMRAGCLPLDPI